MKQSNFHRVFHEMEQEVIRRRKERLPLNNLMRCVSLIKSDWHRMHDESRLSNPAIPFETATTCTQPRLMKALLDDGCFDNRDTLKWQQDVLAHSACDLAKKGDADALDCLKVLLDHGVSPDTRRPREKKHPRPPLIVIAAKAGFVDALDLLKERGADLTARTLIPTPASHKEEIYGNALHEAIVAASIDGARWCLDNEFDVNAPNSLEKSHLSISPVMLTAVEYGDALDQKDEALNAIFALLLDHEPDLETPDGLGQSAMDYIRGEPELLNIFEDFKSQQQEGSLLQHVPVSSQKSQDASL